MDFKKTCPDCFNEGMYNGTCRICGYIENYPSARSARGLPLFHLLGERYLVGKILGVGGFGITYKAWDIYNNSYCAVKEYVPMNISMRMADKVTVIPISPKNRGYFMHGQERFIEEATFLRNLSAIKEIVNITDYFNENNTSYFIMEFLDGENLKSLYRSKKSKGESLPYDFCCLVMVKIGNALDKIHTGNKIFHRDISPENIFITSLGDIKLIDFGNAKHCASEQSQDLSVVLKPGFAPPEQYSTKGVQGPWTDVYSLACTFYLIVSGVAIPPAPDRIQGVGYKPLYQMNQQCTMEVSNIIDSALKLNYKERLSNVMQLISILEKQLNLTGTRFIQSNTLVEGLTSETAYDAPKKDMIFNINMQIKPYIKVIQGDQKGNVWYIPTDLELMLGRSSAVCNIVLTNFTQISNKHCTITYSTQHNGFLVKDVSTNGTVVNGGRLEKGSYYLIKPQGRLCLAQNTCIIEIGVDT